GRFKRRTSTMRPRSTRPSINSVALSAKMRPSVKIGRLLPYQSTHDTSQGYERATLLRGARNSPSACRPAGSSERYLRSEAFEFQTHRPLCLTPCTVGRPRRPVLFSPTLLLKAWERPSDSKRPGSVVVVETRGALVRSSTLRLKPSRSA